MAVPNQTNTAAVKPTDMAQALSSEPESVRMASSERNHGTSTTKPSNQALPPRKNSPNKMALTRVPASKRLPDWFNTSCCLSP